MTPTAPMQQAELIISILSGPDKGAVYKLVSTKVRVGRATDNDIVIKDPRSSRHHAVIELTPEGIFVEDLSNQNNMDVDGSLTKKSMLKSGAHITLGSTVLRFEIKTMTSTPALTGGGVDSSPSPAFSQGLALAPKGKMPASKMNFYIIVGVLALVVVFLVNSKSGPGKKSTSIRTDEAVDEDIKSSQSRREAIEKDQVKRGQHADEYRDIQAMYTQGFRDYREGNYGRALSSFDSVLALKADHELARKYRDLSKRRLDELIQLTMLEGKRYMEQNKYGLAKNAYTQVMIMIKDEKNKQYIEAREYLNECDLLLKGAY